MPKRPIKEDDEQIRFVTWMAKKGILFFAIPNGGYRHLLEAVKLKRMGVKAGVPDVFLPIPMRSFHGLFIELKRTQGAVVSDGQRAWIGKLREKGYVAEIAYGADEAIAIVNDYLWPDDGPPLAA